MPNEVLTRAIDALADGRDLSEAQAGEVLSEIMHGEASEIQIAAFLVALRTKGETVQELAGLARVMRELAVRVPVGRDDLLDTAIHIRTVVVKDGVAHVQAGGGTVADARPAFEFEESLAKAQAAMRAIALACEQPEWS